MFPRKKFPHDHINIFNKQMTDNAKKIHFSEPVYVCLPKKNHKAHTTVQSFFVLNRVSATSHVKENVRRFYIDANRIPVYSSQVEGTRNQLGFVSENGLGLQSLKDMLLGIAWYSCGTAEKRPLEICRMVILFLDWLETKITFSVNFDKNLPTHLLLQISDRVA